MTHKEREATGMGARKKGMTVRPQWRKGREGKGLERKTKGKAKGRKQERGTRHP